MPILQDHKAIAEALEGGLRDILNEVIDGAITDLDGPVREIANRMTLAARRNRPELVAESRDQLVLIVLEKELRLRTGGSVLLDTMIGLGMNALFSGAIAGLRGLKAV